MIELKRGEKLQLTPKQFSEIKPLRVKLTEAEANITQAQLTLQRAQIHRSEINDEIWGEIYKSTDLNPDAAYGIEGNTIIGM